MVAVQDINPYSHVSDLMISSQVICKYSICITIESGPDHHNMEKGKLNEENKKKLEAQLDS